MFVIGFVYADPPADVPVDAPAVLSEKAEKLLNFAGDKGLPPGLVSSRIPKEYDF